ncbi:MAG: substrate-binding domain-containing protein [Cyanobacteriota bacterium]|nr:substrate-binding domain-containing protein [Cyanobacteriota bacterium]
MAIVKLKIRESKDGFQVDLTAKQLDVETEGFLPPLPSQLESSFNNWQLAYRQIDAVRSVFTSRQVRLTPKTVTKCSSAEYTTSVKESLNQWLNCGNSTWLPVRDKLISIAQQFQHKNEEVRIIIDAKDVNLRRLPWQEWKLFEEYYPQVEIALSTSRNTHSIASYTLPQSRKIRVLVAVGRSDGINTKNDLEVIQELEQHGAEVVCLMQPNRKELCNSLWDEKGYHIFIFTGHSGSKEDGQIGWIELNDEDNLSIEEFKEALKQAIDKGLQLAIFNSCDGLGLANQLAQLHIPRCIVMREPVPDRVAVEFLKYFFKEFVRNQSLSKALNRARKRLEHFNLDYPGAIWLPTICIAPNVKSLTWKSLNSEKDIHTEVNQQQNSQSFKPLILAGSIGLIGLIMIGGIFALIKSLNPVDDTIKITGEKSTLSSVKTPSGIFRYGGSTTWEPLRKILEIEIRRNHPNFQLNHQGAIGSEPGIETLRNDRLVNGNLDFVLSSRHLKESETQSTTGDFKLKDKPVAIDGIAIAVNHQLRIPGLTVKNLKDIYTGKVTNWKELGGPNLPIVAYSRNPDRGGTPEFFRKKVLHTQQFGKNINFVNETTEGLQKLEKTPGGIYYASAPEVVPQCSIKTLPIGQRPSSYVSLYKQPYVSAKSCKEKKQRNDFNEVNIQELKKNYPSDLTRKIYVVYKYTDSSNVEPDLREELKATKAGIAYANLLMTHEGKQLVKKAGFVPID